MTNRKEILQFVTEIIEAEYGEVTSEDMRIADSGIDSLSTAVLYLELDDKYGCFGINYKYNGEESLRDLTINDIIETVLNKDK